MAKTLNLVIIYDDENPDLGHLEVVGGDLADAIGRGVIFTDGNEPKHLATSFDRLHFKVTAELARQKFAGA